MFILFTTTVEFVSSNRFYFLKFSTLPSCQFWCEKKIEFFLINVFKLFKNIRGIVCVCVCVCVYVCVVLK